MAGTREIVFASGAAREEVRLLRKPLELRQFMRGRHPFDLLGNLNMRACGEACGVVKRG
jgi:hypothetical protein